MNEDELARLLAHMREKTRQVEGRKLLRETRTRIGAIRDLIDRLRVAKGGVMSAVDKRFDSTQTFQPSTMILTQLRLAIHYAQAADEGGFLTGGSRPPTLSSFVVLRAAIECTASAHWLLSGKNQRESIERVLKRMWWDTVSAAEMATIADGDADRTALRGLEDRIAEISRPVKGLAPETIISSKRMSLSTIVAEAGASLRPEYPTQMHAGWMLCSGISHGNLPVSAGVGISPELVQHPSRHSLDIGTYAFVFAATVEDLHATTLLFERRASEEHEHPGS